MRLQRVIPFVTLAAAIACGSASALNDGSSYKSSNISLNEARHVSSTPQTTALAAMAVTAYMAYMGYQGTAGQNVAAPGAIGGGAGAGSGAGCVGSPKCDSPTSLRDANF